MHRVVVFSFHQCVFYSSLFFKNLREKNFKGEANNKQFDGEDTQRSDFSS